MYKLYFILINLNNGTELVDILFNKKQEVGNEYFEKIQKNNIVNEKNKEKYIKKNNNNKKPNLEVKNSLFKNS